MSGFGMQLDFKSGTARSWYVGSDGVKRWSDNDEPVSEGLRILALDPATKTGWAHSCGASGVWDLSIRRDESAGMRLIRLRGKLEEILKSVGIDVLAFEAARNAAPKMQGALVVQAELQGVIKTFCEDNGIEYQGFSPSEIKKHATGKGNANKQAMIDAARKKFGAVDSDDQADALHLLDLFKSRIEA